MDTLYQQLAHALDHQHPITLATPTPLGLLVCSRHLTKFLLQPDGTALLTFTDGTTFTTRKPA